MALIFEDTFTEASTVALTSHTPSPTGTGWTEEVAAATAVANVHSDDYVYASTTNTNNDLGVSAQPDPSEADVDVEMKLSALYASTLAASFGIFARWADSSNYYGVQLLSNSHSSDSVKLFKRVSGTFTELDTVDATLATNDVIKLEIRGSDIKVYQNGSEILSASDSSITAAGKAGIMWGMLTINGLHVHVNWRGDNFKVTEYASSGWANIAKLDGIIAADIAKINGVLVSDISKVNGVSV